MHAVKKTPLVDRLDHDIINLLDSRLGEHNEYYSKMVHDDSDRLWAPRDVTWLAYGDVA